MREALTDLVAAVPAFATLARDDLDALVAALREINLRPGEAALRVGDASGDLLLVLRGELETREGGMARRGGTYRNFVPGEFVGVSANLLGRPQQRTVRASRRSQVAVLPAVAVELLAFSSSPLGLALHTAITAQLTDELAGLQRQLERRRKRTR